MATAFHRHPEPSERPSRGVVPAAGDPLADLRALCSQARGVLIADAQHAALARARCEWISVDRDFAKLPDLRWRHVLDRAARIAL